MSAEEATVTEQNFRRQPAWDNRRDLLSRLWSLSQVCRTQAATPEHSVTGPEAIEIQQFQSETANLLRNLADQLQLVVVGGDEQGLINAANQFRAIIDYVSTPEVRGEPVSGCG